MPARLKTTPVRLLLLALALGILVSLAGGCAAFKGQLPQEEGLHPRLTRWTYLERGNLAALAVDVQAALKREDSEYIPLGVGVANLRIPKIRLNRESFTLVDEAGRRYALASVQEVRSLGQLMNYDLRLSRNFGEVFSTTYQPWPRRASTFFPVPGVSNDPIFRRRSLVNDRVELNNSSYMIDVLYFPHPEGEILGNYFELWMDSEDLEEPLFVKFRVK